MSDDAVAVAVPAGSQDWRSVASLAVDAVSSTHSKRAYEKALKDFLAWYSAETRPPIGKQYRSVLESASLAPPSINLRPSAILKLATEAAENGLLDRSVVQGIVSLKGVRQSGDRAGNWLTREQARDLLAQPDIETMEGKRDRAILAVFWAAPCAAANSRRSSAGTSNSATAAAWMTAADLSKGPCFGGCVAVNIRQRTPEALSERMIWNIVTKYARQTGLVDKSANHDMRSCRIPDYAASVPLSCSSRPV